MVGQRCASLRQDQTGVVSLEPFGVAGHNAVLDSCGYVADALIYTGPNAAVAPGPSDQFGVGNQWLGSAAVPSRVREKAQIRFGMSRMSSRKATLPLPLMVTVPAASSGTCTCA
jgi:hypothetical protein